MQIVPQPSQGNFTLVYEAEEAGTSSLRFRDVKGTFVVGKKVTVLSGENRVEVMSNKIPAGVYLLELQYGKRGGGKKGVGCNDKVGQFW